MIKEEEAKTKTCPFMHTNCVGSECMAWCVVFKEKGKEIQGKIPSGLIPVPKLEPTDTGYCKSLT